MGQHHADVAPLFLEFSLFPQDLTLGKANCFIINDLEAKWVLKDLT